MLGQWLSTACRSRENTCVNILVLTFCSQCTPAPRGPQTAAQWDQWSAQTREAFPPPPSYAQSSLCACVCVCVGVSMWVCGREYVGVWACVVRGNHCACTCVCVVVLF